METRVGPLSGLSGQGVDGSLMQPLRKIVLFQRPDGSPFGFWQYELSVELSGIVDPVRRQQRLDAGVLAFEQLEKEARLAGPAHWSGLQEEISHALAAWTQMAALLDERAGDASPSTSRVRDLLVAMGETAQRFAPQSSVSVSQAAPASAAISTAPLPSNKIVMGAPGVINTRDDALRLLGEIAAWFKRHEPNSPLAYTLDEAVRRGRLTWPELVAELMPDLSARNALLVSLGIKPPPDSVE